MTSITRAGPETLEELNKPITSCGASWGSNKCPNPVTHVIVTLHAPGFCPVCEPHCMQFKSNGGYRIVTIENFEAERRLGLYAPEDQP